MSYLVFDVESVAIASAAEFIEPATAPSNYKDEAKIAAYIEEANREAVAKAALDVDLARIVAIGWSAGPETPVVMTAADEHEEYDALETFWAFCITPRPTLIGFNCIGFDLPLLLRRSLYLGVKAPALQIGKYRHDGIIDLMLSLSFDGAQRYRSLGFYKRRFALDVPDDPHTGADIAGLVAAGDWDAVASHSRADVKTTVALARRMGVL